MPTKTPRKPRTTQKKSDTRVRIALPAEDRALLDALETHLSATMGFGTHLSVVRHALRRLAEAEGLDVGKLCRPS
jgi:DNA-binding transcriptional regulator/RsmH inhibitor MraZ